MADELEHQAGELELERRVDAALAFVRLVLVARRQGKLGELLLVLGREARRTLEGVDVDRRS